MGAAYFYHLTRAPLEATLPMLLDKARGAGWRVAVRGTDPAQMDALDDALWSAGGDDAFLPHGRAGQPHEADQPILLTTLAEMPNGATCLMAVSGAEVAPDEVQRLDRVCILFDGNDEAAVAHARIQWKALTDAGCAAQYWSEASGRWEKKAEKEPAAS
ncbi:DNA polymerase III subunit chi [Roseovarius nanhaiticus]|uniref:DNA polymerase III, chi subunit n=1 Tax=Roseovarius nanhaiticus TaxID=573024 RepID=A0A1N7GC13_9RHOB|nr:DNA polymerase III subunit chi [Roseovarius nanhaiticus]SEK31304.1 DNA polymerase III, chi subunit [Roseovarius nanhaiticus]SIS10117.1 DNA polymerase III, chi subunit [Roseovarius nanhaiticus]